LLPALRFAPISRLAVWLALLAASLSCAQGAETLFATTLRSANTASSNAGSLYTVDPSTGAAKLVGPIRVGEAAVGIVAVASHPRTGVFYGITSSLSPVVPRSLLSIDLSTASATRVATLGADGSDIGFDQIGTLYMWLQDTSRVGKIDLATGAVTPIGEPGSDGTVGGGIAVNSAGDIALVSASGATGTLDSVDLATGITTTGPVMSGAPYATSIDNLTFSPSGVLYGINSNGGAPSSAVLVTVDPASGRVNRIGALPDDSHGLIFAQTRAPEATPQDVRVWTLAGLAVIASLLIAFAFFLKEKK
jgi:hypothetical protein